jgi:hypothetical protein
MGKSQLPSAYASEAAPFVSLIPIVELLLQNGNSLAYPHKQQTSSGFMPTQGGWVCYVKEPIDFELVASKFDLPSKVALSRDGDSIFDERTWVAIEGPKRK